MKDRRSNSATPYCAANECHDYPLGNWNYSLYNTDRAEPKYGMNIVQFAFLKHACVLREYIPTIS